MLARSLTSVVCVVVLACSEPQAPAPAGFVATSTDPLTVDVTYIANEGVLLTAGDDRVLIDGLHRLYEPEYAHLPSAEQELIETAQAPFDGIDLILVSHSHGDHFHASAVRRHLAHNPSAVLISSQQVTDAVRKDAAADARILARVKTITPATGTAADQTVGRITVRLLGLPHTGSRWQSLQNLGHIVTIGDKTFLHVGDTAGRIADFEPYRLADARIDVAILPAWMLTEGEGTQVVTHHIKPKQIIAVHLPSAGFEGPVSRVRLAFPQATIFTTLLAKRRY